MLIQLPAFFVAALLLQVQYISAHAGYHYEPPKADIITRHAFTAIPTVSPLPPIPSLPALPTPRPPGNRQTHSQSLVQVHSPPSPPRSIASAYRPPSLASQQIFSAPSSSGFGSDVSFPSASGYQSSPKSHGGPIYGQFPSEISSRAAFGAPPSPSQAAPQPLRIPFGKQAVIHYPPSGISGATGSGGDSDFYVSNGRQLKQYAVVEIIDNDIEQSTQPFLSPAPYFNSYRAGIGASGTGATVPFPTGTQINSRANSLVLEQQRLAEQNIAGGSTVALGSGNLGYVRLPNGGISLGSGSLGFVSGQDRTKSVLEARTRSGAPQPDPLHFGHGPLGGHGFIFGFK